MAVERLQEQFRNGLKTASMSVNAYVNDK